MSRVQVPCHIKGAVALQVGDVRTVQGRPGVLVIDVTFPTAGPFELQEITFKNYYTAFLSIRVRQMLCDMDKVLELRLILRQPSPLWLNFTLEELQFFQHGPQSPSSAFTKWLSHPAPYEQPALLLQQALPDPDKVSSEVQQMWMLTEMIRANRTTARIGRFDVDGCYDLNLLSYT
ncbi:nicolin-1 isoform X3 [Vombatus ursinus]|uniref:nicolin-1 isoform X3 n=1 Tax=Vombatus ursinus TaxID=29139 RepID=UPI000FFCEE68|nr:nicolin-1 isoform X3 [Vombatus ursinus]